jgi:hypothetical protein
MKKLFDFKRHRKDGALVFGIIILFFLLRTIRLTGLPIFADEAIYIRWAQVMKAESTLRFLPLSDGKQPLFMWSAIAFLKIFSDPLFAGRFLSVLTGLASMVGIMLLSYQLFKSKKVSLLAALLYAACPFFVFFDRMALVDSMLTMFGIWSLFFAILAVRKIRFDFAMLAGFALGGALLTKSPALFYSLLLPSTLMFASLRKEKNKNISVLKITKFLGLFAAIYIIGYGMYNILRLGPNFELLSSRNYDYVYPLSHILTQPFNPLLAHLKDIGIWFIYLGPVFLLALAIPGLVIGFKNHKKQTVLLFAWFFLPLLAQAMYAKVFTSRYILFVIPYLLIISSLAILTKNTAKKAILVLVVLFAVSSLWQNINFIFAPQKALLPRVERSGYLEEWTAGTGIKEIADYIINTKQENPDRSIVIGTEGYFGTLPDGLQVYLNDTPGVVVIGVGLGFDKVPQSLADSAKSGNLTYLVINSSRFMLSDDEKEKLKLVASYPKAERKYESREYNLYGSKDSLLFYKVMSF